VVSYNISCSYCIQGYSLSSNICQAVCGDGIRVGSEVCDDNNTANSDGCAANCTVELGYFCVDNASIATLNQSVCSPCIAFCLVCSNNASCTQCGVNYAYSPTNNSCFVDCSNITLCAFCTFTSAVICQTCVIGYKVSANVCVNDCGDGIVVA
jgi:cysteine-rich repeat protein